MSKRANLDNWPPIEGRYWVGEKTSQIAVCTNASIDEIKINLDRIAIIGKCVTENIGIEKIIQNVVSNQNIRYLVLCGRESKGHFVSQAIEALKKNGIDKNKRIIGAKGNMPYLRGVDRKLIERFREQVEIVNLVGETESSKIEKIIEQLFKKAPKKLLKKKIKIKKMKEIEAKPGKWLPDPKGYFLINLDRQRKKLVVEHYRYGKINKKIVGDNAKEICDTIAKLNLIGDFKQKLEHAMYLARELKKAEIALENNLDYEQDSKLKIRTSRSARDEYSWYD